MPDIRLPNGMIVRNVPEGVTKKQVMQRAIAAGMATQEDFGPSMQDIERQAYMKNLAQEQGPLDAALIGAGRQMTNLYRGLGEGVESLTGYRLPGSELEDPAATQAYQALAEESPIATTVGEIGGGIAATAVPGMGVANIASLPARALAAGGLGATELGLEAAGTGGDAGDILKAGTTGGLIGAGMEVALPVFGKALNQAYRKITGTNATRVFDEKGVLTEEVRETLNRAGIDVRNLADELNLKFKPQGDGGLQLTGESLEQLRQTPVDLITKELKDEEQIERAKRFGRLGMRATPGDISQTFVDKSKEARLLEVMRDDPSSLAQQLRDIRKGQAQTFESLQDNLIKDIGDPNMAVAGQNLKDALKDAQTMSRKEKNRLYDEWAELAGYQDGIPIPKDNFIEKLYEDPTVLSMSKALDDKERDQLKRLMVQYGIDDDPAAIARFFPEPPEGQELREVGLFDAPNQVTPLTTQNAENFIQEVNAMLSPTSSNAMKAISRAVKRTADDSFDLIDEAFKTGTDAIKTAAEQARDANRQLMQDFSKEGKVGRLMGTKRDGVTPLVEASNVFNDLFKRGRASNIEPLQRTMDQLKRTDKGQQAIKDLQAKFVLDVLDKGFAVRSDAIDNQVLFSGRRAFKELEKLGRDSAETLFADNPKALQRLDDIIQTGEDVMPRQKEAVKGSGGVIVNALQSLADMTMASKLGPVQGILTVAKNIGAAGADERQLKKIFSRDPKIKKRAKYIQEYMPFLATRLGIATYDFEGE